MVSGIALQTLPVLYQPNGVDILDLDHIESV
ncbi:hypothetical protein DSUL_130017 [Desulfovibrionales bacterium]